MGDYEREQERLMALMELTVEDIVEEQYDDEEEDMEDRLEEDKNNSDTEQELESEEEEEEQPEEEEEQPPQKRKIVQEPTFTGKDKVTKWNKHMPNQNVKTPSKNIIRMKLPCVRGPLKQITDPLDIWRNFFDNDMINIIVTNTNSYLESVSHKYNRATYTRPTTREEIEALLGLLLFSGVKNNNNLNIEHLFKTTKSNDFVFFCAISDLMI
ncbi:uncharacterized protein [Leptinotarsa decemlineata]|uniref:uncharacterized protein n=1 Tax=Leptinotarsa decemlineata TaxID=7539 RepID=UPI003D30A75E